MTDANFVSALKVEFEKLGGGGKTALAEVNALKERINAIEGEKPKTFVTITYENGSTWYRKYSDGFIVLGFNMNGTGKFTYPISFKNTSYQVVTNSGSTITKTTTTFSTSDFNYGVAYKPNPLSVICYGY